MYPIASSSIKDAVVFEDPYLVVVEKESGLLSQPGLGPAQHDSLIVRSQQCWPDARIVHRLDRDTSGLIVLALDVDTHRNLSHQFSQRIVEKIYRARVAGQPKTALGKIEAPICRQSTQPPHYCVDFQRGKEAVTHWMVIESQGQSSRVELQPVTGRSHQLRVHMEYLGHPILGDPLYGNARSRNEISRLGLHASGLALRHPHTKEWLQWHSREPF
jgi:tRNA pseudouridine32 synthase/23S rRNA pseudouridine746 synthase